jgi:hypothetical protein
MYSLISEQSCTTFHRGVFLRNLGILLPHNNANLQDYNLELNAVCYLQYSLHLTVSCAQ